MSPAEYALEDNNKVENRDKKENCEKVEDNTGEQNEVKNKSGSDLEGNIEERSSKKENLEDGGETSKVMG